MNKKEVAEIRKNFDESSGFFTMDRILTGFVDAEKNLLYHKVHPAITMTTEDRDVYDETLKKVLSNSVGKKFVEYAFPNTAYETDHAQNLLYTLLNTKLKEEAVCEKFLKHVASMIDYTGPFTVITAYCTYSVRKKNKNDEIDEYSDEMYNYILTAICPVTTSSDGFIFNRIDNEILKKVNTELIIDKSPSDGFLFPTFSNRSADINHVMYYTHSTKKPNFSIVDNVLECNFVMSAETEKSCFQTIISNVAGENLDYTFINSVNEKIKDVIVDNRDNTDTVTIEPGTLKQIFEDCGLTEDRSKLTEALYKKVCGDATLTAGNIVDYKNTIKTPGIKIDIQSSYSDKLRTSVVDGHRCLLVDLDDPTVEINGLSVSLD